MAYYESQTWQAPARQPSWEQPPPPSRSGASSTSQREDSIAFHTQFEEVDRAVDNLVKSGKLYSMNGRGSMSHGGSRQYNEFGSRHGSGDYEHGRPHSSGHMQNFYSSQRYGGGRQSEADQMMQAKRRMAAQRERELRNYHQEQQYNRSVLADISGKSDRSLSPSTMSEEGRRDLIARQHRALYGNETPAFYPPGAFSESSNTFRNDAPSGSGQNQNVAGRGPSPRGVDPFGMGQGQPTVSVSDANASNTAPPSQQEPTSNTSPSTANTTGNYPVFEATVPQKSATSPVADASPTRPAQKSVTAPIGSGMGPIGSRPQQPTASQMLNKRSTTPLASPMTFGFGAVEANHATERSGSAASNPSANAEKANVGMSWGSGSGVWGSKNPLGATSVWG